MSDRRKPTFLCENTLKANGEGGDKRVTRDSLNNMPFALYTVNVSRQLDKSLRQLLNQKKNKVKSTHQVQNLLLQHQKHKCRSVFAVVKDSSLRQF